MDRATGEAWELLQFNWDTAYALSYDPSQAQPFHAERRDGLGMLSADSPDALCEVVQRDYTARPVPREVAP